MKKKLHMIMALLFAATASAWAHPEHAPAKAEVVTSAKPETRWAFRPQLFEEVPVVAKTATPPPVATTTSRSTASRSSGGALRIAENNAVPRPTRVPQLLLDKKGHPVAWAYRASGTAQDASPTTLAKAKSNQSAGHMAAYNPVEFPLKRGAIVWIPDGDMSLDCDCEEHNPRPKPKPEPERVVVKSVSASEPKPEPKPESAPKPEPEPAQEPPHGYAGSTPVHNHIDVIQYTPKHVFALPAPAHSGAYRHPVPKMPQRR